MTVVQTCALPIYNQVFWGLMFSTGTRLVKIAIFSLKTDSYWGRNRCGEVSDSSGFSVAEKTHNQVFWVLQFLPGPHLGKIAIFFTKNFWSLILSEIVSQTHIGAVIDVVKFQIPQVVCC